ncbi:MAG: helix-turn-helix transcriptional regulator [Myxococcota bacterium]|jgi:hypothetical protein|nr:helix-turn-helix transcriptional regulator [Myxococcota bacterium]
MDTPGSILKRERETQGLSLKEISSVTRIPVSSLRHLEDDRFDLFPAEVFAKGFLRNYARELKLSIDEVILAYNAMKQHQRRVEPEPRPREVPPPSVELSSAPLVLPTPNVDRSKDNSPGDGAQHSFRFAYLIVLLVVATSLVLSILFTGTGEAEESDKRRVRSVTEAAAEPSSPWLLQDQNLSAPDAGNGNSWNRPAPVDAD